MTAALGVDDARLAPVAGWDPSLVRRAVGTLGGVAARLTVWRARLGAVARSLDDPACWSGPAARRAGAAMIDVSSVAAAVNAALEESLAAFERLALQVADAQELAERAVWTGRPDLGAQLGLWPIAEAARSADAAAAAAASAAEPLAGLERIEAGSPAAFWDLAAAVGLDGPVASPRVPTGADPRAVAGWWASLSAAAQASVVRSAPAGLGALDGLPAWARDEANRLLLARALRDPGTLPYEAFTAAVVSRRIEAEEAAGRRVQLHLLDLGGDRVVLGLGDLDTAVAAGLLVPGIWNSPGDDLGRLTGTAADVAAATLAAAPGQTVAAVVWLGYRPPATVPGIALRTAAVRGGAALAGALDGLAATRAAAGTPPARTTVLAHSYGTVVVDEAADVTGRLAADAVVLLGSPGMEEDAASLEVPAVFDATGDDDPIAMLGWFGRGTAEEEYGSTGLPEDRSMGHSDYYDPDRPTLPAIGEVVAGMRTAD